MDEILHDNVISVILIKYRINANILLWQSFSILNFGFGIVSDFFQNIDPWVNVKTIRTIAQIFVAFSEKLNFTTVFCKFFFCISLY